MSLRNSIPKVTVPQVDFQYVTFALIAQTLSGIHLKTRSHLLGHFIIQCEENEENVVNVRKDSPVTQLHIQFHRLCKITLDQKHHLILLEVKLLFCDCYIDVGKYQYQYSFNIYRFMPIIFNTIKDALVHKIQKLVTLAEQVNIFNFLQQRKIIQEIQQQFRQSMTTNEYDIKM